MNLFRHGDLIGISISSLPKGLKKKSSGKMNILAEGEVTGHHHRLLSTVDTELLEDGNTMFLDLRESSELSHEEHKTIKVLPGVYKILKEREYDYFLEETRKVLD